MKTLTALIAIFINQSLRRTDDEMNKLDSHRTKFKTDIQKFANHVDRLAAEY